MADEHAHPTAQMVGVTLGIVGVCLMLVGLVVKINNRLLEGAEPQWLAPLLLAVGAICIVGGYWLDNSYGTSTEVPDNGA